MDKKISKLIKNYADKAELMNKLVVTAFLKNHHLEAGKGFLAQFVTIEDDRLEADINVLSNSILLEDVITIFELAIPQEERTTNGAVYTPQFIRDYIVRHTLHSTTKPLETCLCADISCGCGAFLYTLAENIHKCTHASFANIYHNLYGIDVCDISICRAKILLSLVALLHGEIVEDLDFNLFCGNSLSFDFMGIIAVQENKGFDILVGNPPYVRSKHIDDTTKRLLPLWQTSHTGNTDLYIPFFEVGMSVLHKDGILGYITVNSFFKSVNARALRQYIHAHQASLWIIDFGEQLVFKKKLAYTCLAFLTKTKSNSLFYVKANLTEIEAQRDFIYSRINYNTLDNYRGWHLNHSEVLNNIRLIESAGEALGDLYIIKNGIATLANNVFIFRPTHEDSLYYYHIRDGHEYPIEKGVCRNIIKPNTLKTEAEIEEKEEKIITPYDNKNNVITEDFFRSTYPKAYTYLQTYRKVLDARDKGEGDYGAWYAFGRTQAIADYGKKLLFPYMSDIPHFIYMPQQDMMIYCGYAIYNESETELLFLKRVLESCVFDYYMRHTSKPYSTGYYSYAKNYVKSFGVYPFSDEQKHYLLSLNSKAEVDDYVREIYGVAI
ncbi:MAG: N-6 DNA methylase [Bacteroidaceae bacterium]|nr:N-6 DNA methylase [Bacteroidaceae bacterium]